MIQASLPLEVELLRQVQTRTGRRVRDLAVELHTQGLNGKVRTELFEVPENVHPVAEIEFPPGRPGEDPIRLRVELKERC